MSSSLLSVVENGSPTAVNPKKKATDVSTAGSPELAEHHHQQQQQQHALDFIGSSGAVKDLFSLPYALNRPISVAVHNMGGTLLIDGDPGDAMKGSASQIHPQMNNRPLPSHEEQRTEGCSEVMTQSLVALSTLEASVTNSEALTLVNNVIQQAEQTAREVSDSALPDQLDVPRADDYAANYIPAAPEPREYLSWKFHDMNLMVGSNALIYRSEPSTALTVRVEDAANLKSMLHQHETTVKAGIFVADHQHPKLQQVGKPSYAQATAKLRQTASSVAPAASAAVGARKDQIIESGPSTQTIAASGSSFAAPDLDQVQLQTCIVPVPSESVGSMLSGREAVAATAEDATTSNSVPVSPVSTVLDTYLDNIMANVPQLALCLREKGFIQSVKLLNTDEIPSLLLKSGTLDTSTPFETISGGDPAEEIFSPQIMEMNAHALLRFLKSNCTKDNATYLLRRDAGCQNIQLYDISSISAQRQQKWLWWLAMISYRFSNRLRHLSLQTVANNALRRSFRGRQRSLLQNTLELLETLSDMGGNAHESLIAAVCENLADTFLMGGDDEDVGVAASNLKTTNAASPIVLPPQAVSSHQPYTNVSVDALSKAQDHLIYGIKVLRLVLDRILSEANHSSPERRKQKQRSKVRARNAVVSIDPGDDSDNGDAEIDKMSSDEQVDPVVTQLFGLNHKLVNVSLRLAEIHLKNYWSSSAMQNLRTAAQRIADSLYFAQLIDHEEGKDVQGWLPRLQLQYTWLWEQCGHFARSFAADEHWRDRGHASGDDVVSVLQDVEAAFSRADLNVNGPLSLLLFTKAADPLTIKSKGMITMLSPTGIVDYCPPSERQLKTKSKDAGIESAKCRLAEQRVLQRDERRVLVAASLAYSRAVLAFDDFLLRHYDSFDMKLVELLRQRLGDACNETGKVMLNELRSLLMSSSGQSDNDDALALSAAAFCSSAEFWFMEGLQSFESCGDLRNLALLRCNLCQCYKLRANGILANSQHSAKAEEPSHAEVCLQEAANHLQAAHEALETRDVDSVTWDMVSGELAATFLVLGVRRRQSLVGSGNSSLMILHALRLSPGKERSIVEPMERALDIYMQMGNSHQAAATNYQLALFYSKIWTCQRDETKTREKLAAAFNHYGSAFHFFCSAVRGNEATFCLLCLDFASLYATVSGEEGLTKALVRCLDTAEAFSLDAVDVASKDLEKRHAWFQQMDTLATSVEERTFVLLKNLVKLEGQGAIYKDIYRAGLTAKMSSATISPFSSMGDGALDSACSHLLQLGHVLRSIKEQYDKENRDHQRLQHP